MPENDPQSITIPVDPLDSLQEKLGLTDLSPYDVKWTVGRNILEFIKNGTAGNAAIKKTKSQRIWDDEYDVTGE